MKRNGCAGAIDAFSMLLIVRALDVLGYEPADPDGGNAITRGGAVRLRTARR